MSQSSTPFASRAIESARRLPQELDIVALSPEYIHQHGLSQELRMARGRLTLIEHERGQAYACITWDYPGIDDRLSLADVMLAPGISRGR